MRAELIAIGTELLLGYVVNEDTAYLGRVLAGLGISCYRHVTVGDNPDRLAEAIQTALSRNDLVITCGGLGPTVDDITLETIARATRRNLVFRLSILRQIRRQFSRLKIKMPKSNLRQAKVPEGAVAFPNSVGTAPGFLLILRQAQNGRPVSVRGEPVEPRTKLLVALPGPPKELQPMVQRHLVPRLKRYTGENVIRSKTLKTTGITESELDQKMKDVLAMRGSVTAGIYAHPSQVDLRITAKAASVSSAERQIAKIETRIRRRLGNLIFGVDDDTLEEAVGALLKKAGLTIGVAESCTGGLIQHRLTQISGSSKYLKGGVVVYANELKETALGIDPALIKKHGAVSPQTAAAMAAGIQRLAKTSLGLAVTGIAGPTGGSKRKPVGLVYIGLAAPDGIEVQRHQFSGDRSAIKFKASQAALDLLRKYCLRD